MAGMSKLSLAQEQLQRAQTALSPPIDVSDLFLYAFYALENAVVAAAEALALPWERSHPSKIQLADRLHRQLQLPDADRRPDVY